MSSQPDLIPVAGDSLFGFSSRENASIEDYLDHLCAPLLGTLSYAERKELRQEARAHLEFLVEEYMRDGMRAGEATDAALAEYGPPDANGQALLEVWWHSSRLPTSQTVQRGADAATVIALSLFGLASAANHLMLQYFATTPRSSGLYLFLIGLAVVSPLVCGLLVGALVPVRAGAGTCRALALLLVHSLLAGILLLPDMRGMYFALFQLFFWVPVALIVVHGMESLVRQRRHHLQWRQILRQRRL